MSLEEEFQQAAEAIKPVTGLSNDQKLELYAYYKQATVGDNETAKPGFLDITGKSKWEAWKKVAGTSKEDAMKKYIELVKSHTA